MKARESRFHYVSFHLLGLKERIREAQRKETENENCFHQRIENEWMDNILDKESIASVRITGLRANNPKKLEWWIDRDRSFDPPFLGVILLVIKWSRSSLGFLVNERDLVHQKLGIHQKFGTVFHSLIIFYLNGSKHSFFNLNFYLIGSCPNSLDS